MSSEATVIVKELANGYSLHITDGSAGWTCWVFAPDETWLETLTPVLDRGSEEEAWAAGVLHAANHARENRTGEEASAD